MYRLENPGRGNHRDSPGGSAYTAFPYIRGECEYDELWLAYDYRMLPVKIRHVDNKGGILVQVCREFRIIPGASHAIDTEALAASELLRSSFAADSVVSIASGNTASWDTKTEASSPKRSMPNVLRHKRS